MDALKAWAADFLEQNYFGNEPYRWGVALAVMAGAFVVLWLIRRIILGRIQKLAEATPTQLDDLLIDLVRRTRSLFLLVLSLYLGSLMLALPEGFELGLKSAFFIVLFIQAGLWASHVLSFAIQSYLMRRGAEDATRLAVVSLFGFFGRVVVWSVVVLLAFDNLGFDVTAAIAGLGVGGIAVGLALQNVLRDTFASLAIILDKPFEVGDVINIGEFTGTVERIGIKTTRVRSLSGEELVFGNDDLLASRIRNFKRMQERRAVFAFGVLYETPAAQVEAIPAMVREIIEGIEQTRFDRAHFKAFGDSSLDFEVAYYVLVPEYAVMMNIQQQINLALVRRFEELDIGFAYPTRTLYLSSGTGTQLAGNPTD